jgi:hypothetical protein
MATTLRVSSNICGESENIDEAVAPPRFTDRIATTISEIAEARRSSRGRGRWRSIARRIDAVIEECERAHLDEVTVPSAELRIRAEVVLRHAACAVAQFGERSMILTTVPTPAGNHPATVVDLMDTLWAVQEVVLDLRSRGRRSVCVAGIGPAGGARGVDVLRSSPASGSMAASHAPAGGELSRPCGSAVPLRGSPDSSDGACGPAAIGAGDGARTEVLA